MKKLLIQLFFTSLSLQAMYSAYSHEFKTYSLDTMPAYLMNNSEESVPSRVYFQVTATEKPFYIPVVPKKHEPSILDQKIIKRAAYYEKLLYQGIDSVSRLRDELKKIKHDYDSTKNGLGRSDKAFFEKQIEMLESYLSKYGIEHLGNIQRAHNAEQAIESFNLLAADTSVDSKLVQAAKRVLNLREDYHQYLQHNQQELIASLDMVSTPVYPVANFSPEIDARIEKELSAIKYRDGDSFQHYNEIKTVLNEMKNQGLLDVPKDMVPGALIHCILHFIKQFEPTNPLDHPKEFTKSAIKYAAMSVFHIATDGAFLGLEKATALATQVHELMQQDFSELTPNARAELIAEQVADIVKCVLADQIGKRVLPKIKLPELPQTSSISHDVSEGVTPEGVRIDVSKVPESDLLLFEHEDKALEWTHHRGKHVPPKNMGWKDIVKSTKHGDAKYKPGIDIRELEFKAWTNGKKVTSAAKNYKVFKADDIIGAKWGKETCYMRVECNTNTIHGHPISFEEYTGYLK